MRTGAALLLLLAAAAATAQSRIERGRPAGDDLLRVDARVMTRQLGQCVLRARSTAIAKIAGEGIGGPTLQSALGHGGQDCLAESGRLKLPLPILRGSLFEAAFLRDFGRRPLANLGKLPPIDYRAPYSAGLTGQDSLHVALVELGDCTVRQDAVHARDLLLSIPNTPAEVDALQALGPTLGNCVDKGSELKLNRSTVRAGLAEPMWRLASMATSS